MGHKSVRQLYVIEDEIDAVDVYNRLRSHLLIIEYLHSNSTRLSALHFLHWPCRSVIGAPSRTLPRSTASVVETGKG